MIQSSRLNGRGIYQIRQATIKTYLCPSLKPEVNKEITFDMQHTCTTELYGSLNAFISDVNAHTQYPFDITATND